jgi:hypothetical protein
MTEGEVGAAQGQASGGLARCEGPRGGGAQKGFGGAAEPLADRVELVRAERNVGGRSSRRAEHDERRADVGEAEGAAQAVGLRPLQERAARRPRRARCPQAHDERRSVGA